MKRNHCYRCRPQTEHRPTDTFQPFLPSFGCAIAWLLVDRTQVVVVYGWRRVCCCQRQKDRFLPFDRRRRELAGRPLRRSRGKSGQEGRGVDGSGQVEREKFKWESRQEGRGVDGRGQVEESSGKVKREEKW